MKAAQRAQGVAEAAAGGVESQRRTRSARCCCQTTPPTMRTKEQRSRTCSWQASRAGRAARAFAAPFHLSTIEDACCNRSQLSQPALQLQPSAPLKHRSLRSQQLLQRSCLITSQAKQRSRALHAPQRCCRRRQQRRPWRQRHTVRCRDLAVAGASKPCRPFQPRHIASSAAGNMGRRQAAAAAAAAISEAATAAKNTQAELKQLELDYQPRKVRGRCRIRGGLALLPNLAGCCCRRGWPALARANWGCSGKRLRAPLLPAAGRHRQVEEGQQGAGAAHRPVLCERTA